MTRAFFDRWVLRYPSVFLAVMVSFILFQGWQATDMEIDASSETLVLESDKDLKYARTISRRYETQDFLFVAYTPKWNLLDDRTLAVIRNLQDDLEALEQVSSVTSILNVPLLESADLPIKELVKEVPTLNSPLVSKLRAREELLDSPVYQDLLVSKDFETTALQVNLAPDEEWNRLINRRYELRGKEDEEGLTPAENDELERVQAAIDERQDVIREATHRNISQVREVLRHYSHTGDMFLGGVTMISDDLITFVKNDLRVFGTAVLVLLMITLWFIFRQKRWVLIPVLTCAFSVTASAGFLGLFGWEVTVISSNFISLQLIITMAITIHLVVRYRELAQLDPDSDQRTLVLDTVDFMWKPCLFMALTTVAGFSSLMLSDMLPVKTFGWMMGAGVAVSLIITFLVFPTLLVMMPRREPSMAFEGHFRFTDRMADLTEKYGAPIIWGSVLIMALSVAGALQLQVENSFISYFKKSTEIYRGMEVIDRKMGGTTPLDVIVNLGGGEEEAPVKEGGEFAMFDEFEQEFAEEKKEAKYWFTARKMEKVEAIHDYLAGLEETGKVMSLGTMLKVGERLNDGEPLDDFTLALIYEELPEKFRKILIAPYVSVEHQQVRFNARIKDSLPDLRRNELLQRIEHDLVEKLGLKGEDVRLTNLLVLYNNMLQSLFDSQIRTLGAVIILLMVMFLLLFRSLKIALIAIFPNILSVGVVLGFMGWVGIPLDMMTITIAAISVGIAVDDTIHYIHRFKVEYFKDKDYLAAMHRCHHTIGHAMYYTSVIIIIGFSVLVLSNFNPSIYFGLLTGLAMLIALLSALTLLPRLLMAAKPFGPEGAEG